MFRPTAVALLFALVASAGAHASKVYKTVDANGITHYSDRPPAAGVEAEIIAVRAESQQIAELRLERIDQEHRAVVVNRIAGPIEIELSYNRVDNVLASPGLPLRTVIDAETNRVVSTLRSADTRRAGGFELTFSAVPGVDRWRVPQGSWRVLRSASSAHARRRR